MHGPSLCLDPAATRWNWIRRKRCFRLGRQQPGKEPRTRTLPTDNSTNKPSGRTTGCRLRGMPKLGHIGVAPRGGCRTMAGPQQQVSQRKRGMHSTRTRQVRPSIQSPDHLGDLIGTDRAFQTGFDIGHLTTRLPLSLPNRSFTTQHLPHPPRRGCIGFSTNNHEITGSQVSIGGSQRPPPPDRDPQPSRTPKSYTCTHSQAFFSTQGCFLGIWSATGPALQLRRSTLC